MSVILYLKYLFLLLYTFNLFIIERLFSNAQDFM